MSDAHSEGDGRYLGRFFNLIRDSTKKGEKK